MFFVFSRDKMISYFISFCMVMALLGMAFYIKNNSGAKYVSSNNVNVTNEDISHQKNKWILFLL